MVRCIGQSAELLDNKELAIYYLYYDCCTEADGSIMRLPDVANDPNYKYRRMHRRLEKTNGINE